MFSPEEVLRKAFKNTQFKGVSLEVKEAVALLSLDQK